MQKKLISYSSLCVAALLCVAFAGNDSILKMDGGPPYNTNAPSEKTCSGIEGTSLCHSGGIPDNTGPGTPDILFSGGTQYVPGQTYTVTPKIIHSISNRFGFQIVSLKDNNNLFTGTINLLDTAKTRIQQPTWGPAQDRIFVMHRIAGLYPTTPNVGQWSYEWTAPSTNQGNISFYACFVAANGDNLNNSSDETFYKKITITPSVIRINETEKSNISVSVYPNPASSFINVKSSGELGKIIIYNYQCESVLQKQSMGSTEQLDISGLAQGAYILTVGKRNIRFIKE